MTKIFLCGELRAASISMIIFFAIPFMPKAQSQPAASEKPYIEEWVYRVKYGFRDEWWKIFQQYQLATLDKEKSLGYITDYSIYTPSLHTSEDARWDFRIIIIYKNLMASTHAHEVEKSLFAASPDYRKDENRRWELTTNHWDLPIHEVDPRSSNP